MRYFVWIGGREHEVTLGGARVRLGDFEGEGHVAELEGTPVRLVTIAGRVHRVLARRVGPPGHYTLELGGFRFEVEVLGERARTIRQLTGPAARGSGPAAIVAPMPGLVVRVNVQPGDHVQAGQGLVVVEAMKMENELKAPAAGVVRAVSVTPGSAVEKGAVLVEFDAAS